MGIINHIIVTMGRFKDKDLRDKYYKISRKYLAPSLLSQTNKNYIYCLLTYPEDIPVFEKEVGIKGMYFDNRQKFDDYVRQIGAEIQTRHDIDDWMAPNYIEEIQKVYWENKDKYKQFLIQVSHPIRLEDSNGKEFKMDAYSAERNSMFLSICNSGKHISILEKNHGQMYQVVDGVIDLPPGLTKWVRHPYAATELRKYGGNLTDAKIIEKNNGS